MEAIVERVNLKKALARVKRNKGASGLDGMTIDELVPYLKEHWPRIRAQLLDGSYKPQPVRRVEIPKASGGKRPLGIPTVLDRFIQQAVMQVLQADWDRTFSAHSYGFRPQRSAHQAVARAQELIASGHDVVVDIDLEKFLDTASYYPLVHEIRSKSSDCRVITLIRIPFFLPFVTCTTSSSPHLTRCNTVWRETPSLRVASCMVTKPSPAVSLNRAMRSSVRRMRQGAPGVSCSPGMMPSLSQRCKVEGATPSPTAALLMVSSSPPACSAFGSKHGMSQWRRRLPTRLASKRWPYAVVRPWRLRMPAITASG